MPVSYCPVPYHLFHDAHARIQALRNNIHLGVLLRIQKLVLESQISIKQSRLIASRTLELVHEDADEAGLASGLKSLTGEYPMLSPVLIEVFSHIEDSKKASLYAAVDLLRDGQIDQALEVLTS